MVKVSIAMLIILLLVFVFDLPAGSNDNDRDANSGLNSVLKRKRRTVGGSEALKGAFPYQISLRTAIDNAHFCSGSILRPTAILTAAHCVSRRNKVDLIVVAGSNKLSSGGTRHNVIVIVPHENFDKDRFQNDIALLILYPPLFYSSTIKPIELDTSFIRQGVDVTLSGWGKTSFNGGSPDKLHFLNLTTIEAVECQSKSRYKNYVTEPTICTLTKIGEGACMADSGGPLVANGRQVGIVSWGDQCAVGYPDIYTRVYSFIPWIRKNIDYYAPVMYRC